MRMRHLLNLSVYVFVFLTGVSALIYQVVWQRLLTRLLGAETLATSIVLAVFLVGLSLGYLLSGWLSTRLKNAMKGYAILEAITGIWGFAFMFLYAGVSALTLNWGFEPPFWMVFQGLFCTVLLLLVPTVCMGGTVPLLTRALSRSVANATRQHSWIYALNTAGAFLGTVLTGFLLIEYYGISLSIKWAAGINVASALVFYLAGTYAWKPETDHETVTEDSLREPESASTPSAYSPKTLYAVAFFSGCSILSLENVFIRITNLSFASTAYSFTVIVAIFILSLSIGGYLVAIKKQFSPKTLYRNQIWVTATFLLLFFTIDKWPYLAHLTRLPFNENIVGFGGFQLLGFLTLLAILVIPISIAGITLPLIFHELKRSLDEVGFHSGTILFVNGLGSLVGSLLGGFILFYWFQLGDVFLFAVLIAGINLVLTAWSFDIREKVTAGIIAATIIAITFTQPLYDDRNLVIGHFRIRDLLPSSLKGANTFYADTIPQHGELLMYNTGPTLTSAVVSKTISEDRKSLGLYSNGRNESRIGGGRGDELTTKLAAHIPLLLSNERERVFVIGLGTGSTAGEITLYPDVDDITVAEIAPGIWDALPYFDPYTHNLSQDPRLNAESGDAMRILKRRPEPWDIIISEPSNPYIIGADQLFSREFYEIVSNRLTSDGLFCQWIQTYSTDSEIFSLALNTLQSVFPYVYPFSTNGSDYIFLASNRLLASRNFDGMLDAYGGNPKIVESLKEISIHSSDDILGKFESWPLVLAAHKLSSTQFETLEHPTIHYKAIRAMFMGKDLSEVRSQYSKIPVSNKITTRYTENWSTETPRPLLEGDMFR